ncbi:MAG: hypothetical protein FWH20_00265 [Oscillospiraceae bacterium]|nr:hypothetical protein [Oscillospiraceae bacterium]
MADGSIVYEVRVDSSNVEDDVLRAGLLLEKGSANIKNLASSTAQTFGQMLSEIFAGSVTQAENALTRLGAAFVNLKNFAAPLLSVLTPITQELTKISSAGGANLGELLGKASSSSAKSAAASVSNSNGANPFSFGDIPSFASGTNYIPYDDFPALLHKGEAVLTASENAALKNAGGINSIGAIQPIIVKNDENSAGGDDFAQRPVEVSLRIGEYEFTQIIAETMNNLHRQWGARPLK